MGYERAQRNKGTEIHLGRSGGQALTDLNEFFLTCCIFLLE